MEYQGYKLTVNEKTKREMWFKNGKLSSQKDVPEGVKEFLRSGGKKEKQEVDGSKLYGFSDGLITNDAETKKKQEQEEAAVEALEARFPDFEFKVEFTDGRVRGDGANAVKIKPTYKIFILAGGLLEKTIIMAEFSMNVINENIKAMLDEWKGTGRKRNPRRGETLGEKKLEVGTSEKTHVRKITVPKL